MTTLNHAHLHHLSMDPSCQRRLYLKRIGANNFQDIQDLQTRHHKYYDAKPLAYELLRGNICAFPRIETNRQFRYSHCPDEPILRVVFQLRAMYHRLLAMIFFGTHPQLGNTIPVKDCSNTRCFAASVSNIATNINLAGPSTMSLSTTSPMVVEALVSQCILHMVKVN